jgi:hypothetical protein
MADITETTPWNLRAMQAALESPLSHLEYWLAFDAPGTRVLRGRLEALPGRGSQELATRVARMVLDLSEDSISAVALAQQIGVEPSAISQRKSRILRDIQRWGAAPIDEQHDLTLLWRESACRAVKVADLPEWLQRFVGALSGSQSEKSENWGTNEDFGLSILHLAIGRPMLIENDTDKEQWLVDRSLFPRPEAQHSLAELGHLFADAYTSEGTATFRERSLSDHITSWGISPQSSVSFAELLVEKSQRCVSLDGETIIFDRKDSRRAGTMARHLKDHFGLDEKQAAQVLSDEQGRNLQSVLNDLRLGR